MRYMGSKNRIASAILPIILNDRRLDQWYVEPFVGGGNLIDKVSGPRIGADCNPYAINALISIRDALDSLPKDNSEFKEADYRKIKTTQDFLKAYAGFALSYSGKWFGGWCRDGAGKRDFIGEAYRNAIKQSPLLQGIILVVSDYQQLIIPDDSIVYCDPPYAETTGYKEIFDHCRFWQWCERMSGLGHKVFVSEYVAPQGWDCVWEKEISSSLTQNTGSKKGIERLFVWNKA